MNLILYHQLSPPCRVLLSSTFVHSLVYDAAVFRDSHTCLSATLRPSGSRTCSFLVLGPQIDARP